MRSDINSLKEAIFSKQPNSFRAHNSRTQNKNLKNEINKLSFHKFITLGKDTFGHNLDKFIQMITITFDVKDIHISKDKLDRPYIAITTYQDISDELLFEISQHADVKIEDIDDLPF
ncbi:hypothetical protein [Acinetobacter sp. YH12251]|uniref:hypothetical protein n=1 Tax=Acinetobacter sp. YH12251 TaxID=2601176 RepID=UPI0015D0F05A|nr:hypothetical protein [Acinetobacter sp. YH12251]